MLYHSRAAKSHLFSARLPHFPVYLTAFSLYWLLFYLLSLQFWPISPLCLMESWQNCHKCSQMTFYSQWLSQSCTYAKREIKKKYDTCKLFLILSVCLLTCMPILWADLQIFMYSNMKLCIWVPKEMYLLTVL